MVLIKVTTKGVQGVAFGSNHGTMQDDALELWPVIRAELTRLDKRVRQASAKREADRDRCNALTRAFMADAP